MKPYAKLLVSESQLDTLVSLVEQARTAVAVAFEDADSDQKRDFLRRRAAHYEALSDLLAAPKAQDLTQDAEEDEEDEEEGE